MPKSKNIKTKADRLKEEFYKGMAELRKGISELKESQKKTDAQIAKTDAEIDKLKDLVNRVSDGYSRFVEGIISPSAIKYFSDTGYKIKDVYHRIKLFKDRQPYAEYDTVIEATLNDKKYVFIGEAKTHCSSEHIDDFIDRLHKMRKINTQIFH